MGAWSRGKAAVLCVLASTHVCTQAGNAADAPGNAPALTPTLDTVCKMVKSAHFSTALDAPAHMHTRALVNTAWHATRTRQMQHK